jgi:ribosomal 50S subunit-associated protein YjgA (DUF615 family)
MEEIEEFAKTGNGVTKHPLKTISVQSYLDYTEKEKNIVEHFNLLQKLDRFISPSDKTKIVQEVIKRQLNFLEDLQDQSTYEIIIAFLNKFTNTTQEKFDDLGPIISADGLSGSE